ncbi:hypothetical protein RvY_14952 [Ramazzottius varieornatus]|uniref:Uncharacterized protein n=1 Tax=Ramazzottius varieornatus TaxID=947166 RepID=A0A1D1VT41_RAMVA|nr:hypothetical protein RvY_14952 [Ramazzottius varieornatus]
MDFGSFMELVLNLRRRYEIRAYKQLLENVGNTVKNDILKRIARPFTTNDYEAILVVEDVRTVPHSSFCVHPQGIADVDIVVPCNAFVGQTVLGLRLGQLGCA